MEASWLACLIVTPLLFDVQSNSVFELEKAAVVRTLALVLVVAGLLRVFAGRPQGRGFWVVVALAYLAVQAFATSMSVAPYISLWGSFTRLQGLYTTAAYVVLFLAVLTFCRRRSQVERIIQACLLTSLPVSLYGIIQRFGTDPVPWLGDVARRPASTMGNPIFLAAFLIMVVPLTLYRYMEVGRVVTRDQAKLIRWVFIGGGVVNILLQLVAWSRGPVSGSLAAFVTLGLWTVQGQIFSQPLRPFVRTGVYSVLLSAQLAAILLSGSRGPLLALLVGSGMFVALWALTRGKRSWLAATAIVLIAGAISLLLLNHPASPLRRFELQTRLPVNRFARLLEGSGRVRLLLWEGAAELISHDSARLVWGYGPESGQLVLSRHVPAELGRMEEGTPDRSHNETFDVLVTTGLLGLTAYVALFTAMLISGLRWAGAAATRGQRRLALAMCLAGAASSVALARVIDGSWRFSGLALPAGMVAGVFLYLAGSLPWSRSPASRWCNRRMLAVLLFSALVAHFVEIQVGIAITSTRAYFWIYLAMLVGALADFPRLGTKGGAGDRAQGAAAARYSRVSASLMITLALVTLVFDFVPAKESSTLTVLWLVGCSGLLAALMLWSESVGQSPGAALKNDLTAYVGVPLVGASLFAALHRFPALLVDDPTLTPAPFYLALLVLVAGIAAGLTPGRQSPSPAGNRYAVPAAVGLGVLALVLFVTTNLDLVRADISFKQAQTHFSRQGQTEQAELWARRALAFQPSRDDLYGALGRIRTRRAELVADDAQRERIFAQAEENLATAHELSPLAAAHSVGLARLYRSWGEHARDEERRRALFDRASSCYQDALDRYPTSFRTWNELGAVYVLTGQIDQARATFEHSLALNDVFSETHVQLARIYTLLGRPDLADAHAREAVRLAPPGQRDEIERLVGELLIRAPTV